MYTVNQISSIAMCLCIFRIFADHCPIRDTATHNLFLWPLLDKFLWDIPAARCGYQWSHHYGNVAWLGLCCIIIFSFYKKWCIKPSDPLVLKWSPVGYSGCDCLTMKGNKCEEDADLGRNASMNKTAAEGIVSTLPSWCRRVHSLRIGTLWFSCTPHAFFTAAVLDINIEYITRALQVWTTQVFKIKTGQQNQLVLYNIWCHKKFELE